MSAERTIPHQRPSLRSQRAEDDAAQDELLDERAEQHDDDAP